MKKIQQGYIIKLRDGTYATPNCAPYWLYRKSAENAIAIRLQTYNNKKYLNAKVVEIWVVDPNAKDEEE